MQSCGSFFIGFGGSHGYLLCGCLRAILTSIVCPLARSLHFGLHAESWMCSHVETDNGPRRQQSWNFSEMWGLAYLLSGRPVGPTKRVYDQMASSNLSVQEWFAFLSLAGHHGGSGAQVANRKFFRCFSTHLVAEGLVSRLSGLC